MATLTADRQRLFVAYLEACVGLHGATRACGTPPSDADGNRLRLAAWALEEARKAYERALGAERGGRMDREQWLKSADPQEMLRWLTEGCGVCDGTGWLGGMTSPPLPCERCGGWRPRLPSDRKLRLLACALRRAVVGFPWDGQSQGWADMEEGPEEPVLADGVGPAVVPAVRSARLFIGGDLPDRLRPSHAASAAILRDTVGDPWAVWFEMPSGRTPDRPAFYRTFYRAFYRAWRTPDVMATATGAYDDRLRDGRLDPARLAVLADALTDAGCDEQALLAPLRAVGDRYRGFWVLDLVLGEG